MSEADSRFMRLALGLAARGLGNVWPNPAVGCVIVKEGRIVGRGWTQPGGRPHAEIRALAQAGAAAQGATVYVTLEPCAHHGKTPPCAEALIAAKVARVVTALQDPDPRVKGAGHAMLRAAGITVREGVLEAQARAAQAGFLTRITKTRPWIALKLATSFDGRIATASGESQWITGPRARAHVHALRAQFDAVMVGGGTARADDPLLTVRHFQPKRSPARVVASKALDLPRKVLAGSLDQAPLWMLHGPDAPIEARTFWQEAGAELIEIPVSAQQLDLKVAMRALGERGLTRVFCEGGGAFGAALLRAGLIDELIGYTAGLALGSEGRAGLGALGLDHLGDAPRFDLVESRAMGGDLYHRWRRHTQA
ncbi:MAG: bifunctional diaminohydroxyphosphoribosylaminopyrimidine deaminase/5-amino-6-(5-phosphoribosylamino)uracil reductase RibD [Rhodobacteraceae bacterium]|nr:bifunctional diaminohydroxyphosphoribosylaminopyrimidine deaminase/5-amino-6-(5-phosphoribosylamino)uracil reductase RibD [Paracoccaceae bacterium]